MYAPPRITTLDATKLPDAPDGWKYANLTDPTVLGNDDLANYPVVLFGSYTYTGARSLASLDCQSLSSLYTQLSPTPPTTSR